jgi:hypothetical protein
VARSGGQTSVLTVQAKARWSVLLYVLPWLALCLAGCADLPKLLTGEGTASAAKTRVKFILQTIKEHGSTTDTQLQTAICRWDSDKIFISDRERLASALEAFDTWRQQARIYPVLQTFGIDDKVEDRHDTDPEGTYYVSVTIDGVAHRLRVPPKARLSWVDSNVTAAAAAPAPQTPHEVAPIPDAELQRKRAEWEEHLRMTEQTQADLQAWRRSRQAPAEQAVPRVTAAPSRGTDEAATAMRAWYRGYRARSSAVSLALSQLGMAPDPRRLLAACRDLRATSEALLGDPQALAAPLATVSGPLTTAYNEILAAATSCLASRADEQTAHLAAARQAMSEAAASLRPFQLTP